jgi:anti-anti-sigma regulatory factor
MSVRVVRVGVQRVARLHRVSVAILTTAPHAPLLADSLSEIVAGDSPVVVIDCLGIEALDPAGREAVLDAHRELQRSARHLLVVNLPQPDVAVLREHGVDVSATEDVRYAEQLDAPRGADYRQANTGCS